MRVRHYLRKPKAAVMPREVLVFDTETFECPDRANPLKFFHSFKLGCALYYRLEKGRRTRVDRCTFRHWGDFWVFLMSKIRAKQRLYVFAHNMPFDLTIVRGWGVLSDPAWNVSKAVMEASPFIIKAERDGASIIFADTFNYYKASVEKLGKTFGREKLAVDFSTATDAELEAYCMRDVEITADAVDHLIAYHCGSGLGPWANTVAGLAMSAFKYSFMDTKILVHDNEVALRLERGGYFGGVVECGHVGPLPPGPLYELDVNSMYPSVMLNRFPVRLDQVYVRPSIDAVRWLLGCREVIADVTVETDRSRYPVRRGGRLYHPIGRYRTTLPGPELAQAYQRRELREVHTAATYFGDYVFRRYVQHFYALKRQYDREGNELLRETVKLYLNALYGKFGQMSEVWMPWCAQTWERIAEIAAVPYSSLERYVAKPPKIVRDQHFEYIPEVDRLFRCRHVLPEVEIACDRIEYRDSVPAVAAWVTSYARLKFWRMAETVGVGHHHYGDTDSILTDWEGMRRLGAAGLVRISRLGGLKPKSIVDEGVVFGPKHLILNGNLRCKGVRKKAVKVPSDEAFELMLERGYDLEEAHYRRNHVYRQDRFENTLSIIARPADGTIVKRVLVKSLACVPTGWRVPCHHPVRESDWCTHPPCVRRAVGEGARTAPPRFPDDDPGPKD